MQFNNCSCESEKKSELKATSSLLDKAHLN